jgi:hypothetical protein
MRKMKVSEFLTLINKHVFISNQLIKIKILWIEYIMI